MAEAKTTKPKATKTTAEKTAAPAKTAKAPAKAATVKPAAKKIAKSRKISAEERYKMIEVAAYYIAERHDFKGNAFDFWTAAEAEIDAIINK